MKAANSNNASGKFFVGQELSAKSICNSDCVFKATVLKRTAKFVTLQMEGENEAVRVGITTTDGVERVWPLGRYSMAPSFRAS